MVGRRALAVLLVPTLAFPAGATSEVIGTVIHSQATHVDGVPPLPGMTVFSGNRFEVAEGGTAQIALRGGGIVQVGAESLVRLTGAGEKFQLEIRRGRVRFRTMPTARVEARLADATAVAAGDAPAVGVVALLSRTEGMIAAEKWSLEVRTAHDGKSVTLREGEFVTLKIDSSSPQAGGAAGFGVMGFATLTAVAVGTLVAMLLIFNRGHKDEDLTDRQRRDAVSPFRFP